MCKAPTMDPCIEVIWKYLRGDMKPREFHKWGMNEPRLFEVIGQELYFKFVEIDHVDLAQLDPSLESLARQHGELRCACVMLPNLADIDMGDADARKAMSTLELRADRDAPYWWLSVYQCTICRQWWLVAQEERINDVYLLKRLSEKNAKRVDTADVWPDDFDSFEAVIKLGRDRGHRCKFTEEHNSMLAQTTAELAEVRHDISIRDLVYLFDIDECWAQRIADTAIQEYGAPRIIGNR